MMPSFTGPTALPVELTCSRCGAPLPLPAAAAAFVCCAYCGTSLSLMGVSDGGGEQGGVPTGAPGGAHDSAGRDGTASVMAEEELSARRLRMIEGYRSARACGRAPYEALCQTARIELGDLGQTDALARVVVALVRDFEAESGLELFDDTVVVSRFVDAYLQTLSVLRRADSHVVELLYLTATAHGPVHYRRELSAAVIRDLAQRDPCVSAGRGSGAPRRRRWYWPFG